MKCLKVFSTRNDDELETDSQYKERWRSIHIIYFTLFLKAIGQSLLFTGTWPYLTKLDLNVKKDFMGFIVAAGPLGETLFSPLIGWWSNRFGSIRIPILTLYSVYMFSSGIYALLELLPNGKYWMLGSRFLIGMSAAITPQRAYLAAATRYSERTKSLAMLSLVQTLAFIIGPAIQAAIAKCGTEGVWIIKHALKLDIFSVAGWINAFIAIVCFLSYVPLFFKEHNIAAKEAMLLKKRAKEEDTWKDTKLDYLAIWTLLFASFVMVLTLVVVESLAVPMAMDQFAWTRQEAVYNIGLIMSAGATIGCITFISINPICKYFPEWKVMIFGGVVVMLLSQFSNISWGGDPPKMYHDNLKTDISHNVTVCEFENVANSNRNSTEVIVGNMNSVVNQHCTNESELVGCPSSQEWCAYTPALTVPQYVTYYILFSVAYPVAATLIISTFSKILGPRPQGLWMGLMVGFSTSAKVIGPILLSYIYSRHGPIVTFSLTTCIVAVCLIWLLIVRKRLIPMRLDLNESPTEMEAAELRSLMHLSVKEAK